MIELLGIHSCENVRDRDMLRASCYAIAAGGAGNQMFAAEYLYNLIDSSLLLVVERPKVLHEGQIILHLYYVAHTGKNHHYAGKACRKAKSIACRAASV